MPDDLNFALPLRRDQPGAIEEADGVWAVEQKPSNFIVLYPSNSDDAPTLDEVLKSLSKCLGTPVQAIADLPSRDQSMAWAALIHPEALPAPVIIWAEPMRPMAADELKF